jgi:hypothetical protein
MQALDTAPAFLNSDLKISRKYAAFTEIRAVPQPKITARLYDQSRIVIARHSSLP